MATRLTIPRTFDPSYSLLGRWLRGRADRLQAEARYYLYAVTLFVAMTVAGFVVWAFFADTVAATQETTAARVFFGSQVAGLIGFVATCIVGFRPRITIDLSSNGVLVQQDSCTARVAMTELVDVETVTALTYHRTHRRYAGVTEFRHRSASEFLMLHLRDRTVALGLDEEQRAILTEWVSRELAHIGRTYAHVA